MHNGAAQCTLEGREEAEEQRKLYKLKLSSCLKIVFSYFIESIDKNQQRYELKPTVLQLLVLKTNPPSAAVKGTALDTTDIPLWLSW